MASASASEVGSVRRAGSRAPRRGFETARRVIDLGRRTGVMGILNVTPDSFYDGGRYDRVDRAVARAERLVAEGADVLDVGGESTRPGSRAVDVEEEIARVVPVIARLAATLDVPVSVDTSKARVARLALDAGAEIVNDVSALGDPDMAGVVADRSAAVVLMHMRGSPASMRALAMYDDVAGEVLAELAERVERARSAGIDGSRIVIDPGLGFAKTAEHSWRILEQLDTFLALDLPLLVGPSRKSFLSEGREGSDPGARLEATCAAVVACVLGGADLVRVHDPAAVRPHLAVADRLRHGPQDAQREALWGAVS